MPDKPSIPRTCEQCGKEFLAFASNVRKGGGKFCSRACAYAAMRVPLAPLEERFWSKVDTSDGPDACWPWMGSRNKSGYGHIVVATRQEAAHRLSYTLNRGPIPVGLFVCHACDNPCCVNPVHLFLGTHLDNMADMAAKGRKVPPRGERNTWAKLTTAAVRAIRSEYETTGTTPLALAAKYGVARRTIYGILLRRTWKHL